MDEKLCECVAEKAEAELTEAGAELLLAILEQDDELAEKLRSDLSIREVMTAGTFMVSAPAQCANQ